MTSTDICAPLRNGSWSQGGLGAFTTTFSDPGGEVARFVSWALDYVSPLNDWLDELTGNEAEVTSFATAWRRVGADISEGEVILRNSDQRIALLKGKTSRAMRKLHDEIRESLGDTAEWSEATATALELASTIVGAVHDAIVGALSELAGLVTTLFGFTLNPFDRIDDLRRLSNRAIGFIEIIADLIQRMFDAFGELVDLLSALVPLIAEGLQRMRERLGVLLREVSPLAGPLAGILGGAASDLLAGDPRVTELNPDDLTKDQRDLLDAANKVGFIGSYADLMRSNGLVDQLGGSERGVIDIMEIAEGDGGTHYIVTLPSTQDWGLLKGVMDQNTWDDLLDDYPATNDLDSNVALMLMDNPLLATQYERAVMQAMSDAGVPPGADVVYSGFSQGGIMAANLASNLNPPYNTIGVITNGSPVGLFPIPPHIPVVSFEHYGDIVPALDLQPVDVAGVLLPNRHVVVLPPPGSLLPDQTHHNGNYVDSVAKWEAGQTGTPFFGGTVVDRQQHTWSE